VINCAFFTGVSIVEFKNFFLN